MPISPVVTAKNFLVISFRTLLFKVAAYFNNRLTPLILTVLVMLALLLTGINISRMIYPFDVGHFEACVWTPALLSAEGKNPYAYATQESFVMAPYGYGYYLTVGAGVRLLGEVRNKEQKPS